LYFRIQKRWKQLEAIVHPFVRQAIDILIRRAKQNIVVIEAIKLIENGLAEKCDSVWVVYTLQSFSSPV